MDPYLENPIWISVHTQLIAEIARQLAPKVRPHYLALTSERFVSQMPEDGGIPERVPHVTVEIQDRENRQLVTAIEVLTATNKGGEGRYEYLEKRRRLLLGPTHLIEIDLLRHGQRLPIQQALPDAPYFVFLTRAHEHPACEVWPITLKDALPNVPEPLLAGDDDVSVNLQIALTTVYDLCGYVLAVDYRRPPEVCLEPEEAACVDEWLRFFGFRP
jgi:hypothetical protein